MFSTFPLKTKNKLYNLKCIQNDYTCKIILKDWNDIGDYILSSTKDFNTVIQAGGNIGMYAVIYSEIFQNVFTFEPDPKNFYCLSENCKNNKIIKFNTAIGNENKFVNMNIVNEVNTGMNKIVNNDGFKVYCMTLDGLDIPDVSLMHIDVEGFEYEVLLGAENTIRKHKPTLVLEMAENTDKIYKFLDKLSYKEIHKFRGSSVNSIFVQK